MTTANLNAPAVVTGRVEGFFINNSGDPWLANPTGSGQVYKINYLAILCSTTGYPTQTFRLYIEKGGDEVELMNLSAYDFTGTLDELITADSYIYLEEGASLVGVTANNTFDAFYTISFEQIGAVVSLFSPTAPNLANPQTITGTTVCETITGAGINIVNPSESGQVIKVNALTLQTNKGSFSNIITIYILRFGTILTYIGDSSAVYVEGVRHVICDRNPIYLEEGDVLQIVPGYVEGAGVDETTALVSYDTLGQPPVDVIKLQVNVERVLA
jgi:hypothetical protein